MKYTTDSYNYQQSQLFQNFVANELNKYGYLITLYNTKKEQFEIGESVEGFEIKNDKKYSTTGNLYIEIGEKSNDNNKQYCQSGIKRNDNTHTYIIGDQNKVWLFEKKYLLEITSGLTYIENKSNTSLGYLLPISTLKYFDRCKYIDFVNGKASNDVDQFIYNVNTKNKKLKYGKN